MSEVVKLADVWVALQGTNALLERLLARTAEGSETRVVVDTPPALLAAFDQLQAGLREAQSVLVPAPTEVVVPPLDLEPLHNLLREMDQTLNDIPERITKKLNVRVTGGGAVDPQVRTKLDSIITQLQLLNASVPDTEGTWSYYGGTSGSVSVTGRVLTITAIAQQAAGSIQINGGDTIPLPYGSTDKVSSALTISPNGNLVSPSIVFTGTDAFFVEVVSI